MRGVRRPPRSAGRARTSQADPTLTQIREFYHLPVEEASEQLGVNKSKLKRLCRENGVSRWPQRKLQSLVALRQHIQGDDRLLPQEREAVLSRLEQQWAAVLADPDKALEREFEDMRKNLYKVTAGTAAACRPCFVAGGVSNHASLSHARRVRGFGSLQLGGVGISASAPTYRYVLDVALLLSPGLSGLQRTPRFAVHLVAAIKSEGKPN
ncbi:hypothetical protein Vretimale_9341 [Volvox reticuliferus]|uniref:RWP-RK domain-containing protein n=1 Tax=Volvox reticuliferus TaxID=1737510 RepID=A0A8J4GD54_9CHLO|nr:hypothetical protein Vretimale_9341 [Volvox reticuliferus]